MDAVEESLVLGAGDVKYGVEGDRGVKGGGREIEFGSVAFYKGSLWHVAARQCEMPATEVYAGQATALVDEVAVVG